jgi:ABC-type uncharacterized transport system auxiliary subunit
MYKNLILSFIVLFFHGCVSTTPSLQTNRYFIPLNVTPPSIKSGDKILKIEKPHFSRDLTTTAMAYEKNGAIYEYAYNQWSSPVNELLSDILVKIAETSTVFKDALPAASESKTDYILESHVLSFRQHIDEHKATVRFEIKLSLINAHSKKFINSKRFSYQEPCTEVSAKGGVEAFTRLMKQFEKDVTTWLEKQPI